MIQNKTEKRIRLKAKIKAKITGTLERPRLSVFRSNKFIYAQLIDDTKAMTLASASDIKMTKGTKTERAAAVGKMIAEAGNANKINSVVFDRNGFKYTGRIKVIADAARAAGLVF
ncbi:MAG: 50S ribosomal protein L18 [Candidatus Nomurabacteria bacterium]|nr:50S ribosomal protein L18 [Candidatus Nomurabacteria bacterium]